MLESISAGYVIIMEYREGKRLSDIWHMLDASERAHIENECLKAIDALRAISIRLDDPGKHNVLYARESRAVTFLDLRLRACDKHLHSYLLQDEKDLQFKVAYHRRTRRLVLTELSAAYAALLCLIHTSSWS